MSNKIKKAINIKYWQKKMPQSSSINLDRLPYKNCVYGAFAVNAILIILIFIFKTHLPPQIPLYYGLARGEQQLAENIYLSIPSLASSLILIANLVLAYFIKDEFIQKTLVISALAGSLLATITVTKIIFVVGSF